MTIFWVALPIESPYFNILAFFAIALIAILWPKLIVSFTTISLSPTLIIAPDSKFIKAITILSVDYILRIFFISTKLINTVN